MKWRYYWRRYIGWIPLQWCMMCGRPYWGGWPRWTVSRVIYKGDPKAWVPGKNCHRAIVPLWLPWWKEYCSRRCADDDLEML